MKDMWFITDEGKPIALFDSKKEAYEEFEMMGLGSCSRFQIQSSSECDHSSWDEYSYIKEMMMQDKAI